MCAEPGAGALRRFGRGACVALAVAAATLPSLPAASVAAAVPTVQTMIVGAGNVILSPARPVAASPASVRVGSRTCGVTAGTPLAALADLHAAGGPGFAIRDYGRCTRSTGGSGQLFVYSLDGERNHGQNGWEYKVGNRSGSTGAGDPSGPRGDGRLLVSGQRLLWFWCQSFAGGCQRNLGLSASSSVARRGTLTVRVTGYDNEGRGVPMSGAVVRLGASSAVTGGSGQVTLRAPAGGGRYALTATRNGSVPSFPETVLVR